MLLPQFLEAADADHRGCYVAIFSGLKDHIRDEALRRQCEKLQVQELMRTFTGKGRKDGK